MPYANTDELPKHVKKYGLKIQRQWMHVFNSVYNKLKREKSKNIEARAFKASNSVLKQRFVKGQNASAESHTDYFHSLIDDYLGNLMG